MYKKTYCLFAVLVAVADVVAKAPYYCPAGGRGVGTEGRRRNNKFSIHGRQSAQTIVVAT